MRRGLPEVETRHQPRHLTAMAQTRDPASVPRATQRPAGFEKPAHWTNEPPPRPGPLEGVEDDPQGLSPTRYGDWVQKGIAIDFS
jgi:hypothetical protein